MTGWHIRRGYSSRASQGDVEAALIEVVKATREDTIALIDQAKADGQPCSRGLVECLEHYQNCDDATLTYRTTDDGGFECTLLASGGGESRNLKERARRIFVREVMRRMHAREFDITVVVA